MRAVDLTYAEVGGTGWPELPSGYVHLRRKQTIGHGRPLFDRAADQLLHWELQRRAGIRVDGPDVVSVGAEARLHIALGPLRFTAPVRVVHVLDEPDHRGFAYGTLPGHPERGEELFSVRIDDDETVTTEVVAFSRPGRWFTRLGLPFARGVQRVYTGRYLAALVP